MNHEVTEQQIAEEAKYNEIEFGPTEYSDGSLAKGWYQYEVMIQTVRVNNRRSRRVVGEKCEARWKAELSAEQKADQIAVEFRKELAEEWFKSA